MPVSNSGYVIPAESGVAWGAIIAGAFVTLAVAMILTPLAGGLGFAIPSPWHPDDEQMKTVTAVGAIWVVLAQWVSAGLGGYLTGRLRRKWASAHDNEVFFRDTVHGFLAWALAAIVGTSLIFASAAGAASHMANRASSNQGTQMGSYYLDSLFRSADGIADLSDAERRQASVILDESLKPNEGIPTEDRAYLIHVISVRTGISAADAGTRLDETSAQRKEMLDKARKAASGFSLLLCISLLVGAFVASAAGALGGRDRDAHYETGSLTASL